MRVAAVMNLWRMSHPFMSVEADAAMLGLPDVESVLRSTESDA